jgi:hypothetical protein
MATNQVNPGAHFEIIVGGTPRSYRDDLDIAVEAAKYLKSKNPTVDVSVRDIRNNVVTPVQRMSELPSSPNGKRN